MIADRVGLGWRGELGAAMLERLAELEVLEVVAEDWTALAPREWHALADLAAACPVVLHGVSMGLASQERVAREAVDAMARLVERVRPEAWSEHLAFVRAGGVEIGHLAAPPRTPAVVEGTARNIEVAARTVGSFPCLENVATLIDPPGSAMDEGDWVTRVVEGARVPLLLDLHNLYANGVNFGLSPMALLDAMPLGRVAMIHLAGGRWIRASSGATRLLDDHRHDVPDPVYALLEEVARRAPRPLTVIVERDGRFEGLDPLLAEVRRAREALARGRAASMAEAA